LIVLNFRYCGTEYVHDRYRLAAALAELGAGEHEEVLAVPPHPGCQVVEPEERSKPVSVLFTKF
jgi:hypothetical protein